MPAVLGIDTSNYTTSAALYDMDSGAVRQVRRLLPVKPGQQGLRQSDAVFSHVKALGGILEELFDSSPPALAAVGVSNIPRDVPGSYMPCFLAGEACARAVAASHGVPLYTFSHQAGHIAAALYAVDSLYLWDRPFIAFHLSGGTTECLLVSPDSERVIRPEILYKTLDLNAGQAVDRVGAMLGLPFPAGPALEQLALTSGKTSRPRPSMKGGDCCLSGLENRCASLLQDGEAPEDVARFCLDYLAQTVLSMTEYALAAHPGLPLLFSGGVASNSILRDAIAREYGALFAPPAFSSDNAAGIAVLCAETHRRR